MKFQYTLTFLFSISFFLFFGCEKAEVSPVVNPPVINPATPTEPPIVEKGDQRIAFYNVENLFDTVDDPNNEKDDEFLPEAAKKWTLERYQSKIENIGKVMQGLEFPVLMGFAEVENKAVLEDLINSDLVKNQGYDIVHEDSPDYRGIDVALIYKNKDFTVLESEAIEVTLPSSVSQFSTTRDILLVKGILNNETVYVFINHWPSRSGGAEESSGKREFAASVLRAAIDDILAEEPTAQIIAIGDFNDEPFNDSMIKDLKAKTEKMGMPANELYNCTIGLTNSGGGSYFYRSNWQMIDQAIVSGALLDETGGLKVLGFNVFKDELVLFDHPDNGLTPNRTYGGDAYYGGFSDHLAVYLEVNNL